MLKNEMMKKAVRMFAMFVMALCLSACGCAKEDQSQKPSATVEMATPTEAVLEDTVLADQATPTEATETKEAPTGQVEGEGGGNENKNDSETIVYEFDVLITEAEYYYNNAPISLDDLIKTIEETEGEKLVVIADNNATQNAYEALTKRLDELEIPYEDKKE